MRNFQNKYSKLGPSKWLKNYYYHNIAGVKLRIRYRYFVKFLTLLFKLYYSTPLCRIFWMEMSWFSTTSQAKLINNLRKYSLGWGIWLSPCLQGVSELSRVHRTWAAFLGAKNPLPPHTYKAHPLSNSYSYLIFTFRIRILKFGPNDKGGR